MLRFALGLQITEVKVSNAAEVLKLLADGEKRRHVATTSLNAQSSRSHMIFSLLVTSKAPDGTKRFGKLSLVDLAGSEKVDRSEVTGEGFKEAVEINKSLSALLDVIDALTTRGSSGQSKTGVPYRNHPLTELMADSLGGNAKTLMFVNISPSDKNADESRSALAYATRASRIKVRDQNNESECCSFAELSTDVLTR